MHGNTDQRLYHVEGDAKIELVDELELASGEDAPMSMAAHPSREEIVGGINSSEDALKSGPNQNCRVYNVKENKHVSHTRRLCRFPLTMFAEYRLHKPRAHWSYPGLTMTTRYVPYNLPTVRYKPNPLLESHRLFSQRQTVGCWWYTRRMFIACLAFVNSAQRYPALCSRLSLTQPHCRTGSPRQRRDLRRSFLIDDGESDASSSRFVRLHFCSASNRDHC